MFNFLRRFREPVSDQDYANEFTAYLDGKKGKLSRFLYENLAGSTAGAYKRIERFRGLRKRVPQADWGEILNLQDVPGGIKGVLRGQNLLVSYQEREGVPFDYHIFQFTMNGADFPGHELLRIIKVIRYADWLEKNLQHILAERRSRQEEDKRRREAAEALRHPYKDLLSAG